MKNEITTVLMLHYACHNCPRRAATRLCCFNGIWYDKWMKDHGVGNSNQHPNTRRFKPNIRYSIESNKLLEHHRYFYEHRKERGRAKNWVTNIPTNAAFAFRHVIFSSLKTRSSAKYALRKISSHADGNEVSNYEWLAKFEYCIALPLFLNKTALRS